MYMISICLWCFSDVGFLVLLCVFFFQAEDGIRDLVRSRGLGDVYKRQVVVPSGSFVMGSYAGEERRRNEEGPQHQVSILRPVSYTHLTLPTSDLV